MKSDKKFTMKIETGVNSSISIFSRVYVLSILEETENYSIINFKCYDLVPSGYIEADSEKQFCQNLKIKFKDDNINKNISKLALKFDTSLYQNSWCPHLNKSRSLILQKLKDFEKETNFVMEI